LAAVVAWAQGARALGGELLAQPAPQHDDRPVQLLSWVVETPSTPPTTTAGAAQAPTAPQVPATAHPTATQETPAAPTAAKPGDSGQPASIRLDSAKPIAPTAEPQPLAPAEIEATSFNGVTPGISSPADVQKAWGQPKQSRKQGKQLLELYAVKPFSHVEVSYQADKVAAVVIRLEHPLAADALAAQLELAKLQPVLVSNDLGEILGQAYPERGVLLSFASASGPGKTSNMVTSIVLEPLTADPFVLRSETNLDTRPAFSLHDADQALKLQPNSARAHWLRSRALAMLGDYDKALQAAAAAVRFEPGDCRYLLTHARALAQAGYVRDAISAAEKALAASQPRPHVRARTLCLLGDLKASSNPPDFKKAGEFHTQAIQAAETLVASRHPAIRIAAKEALLDARLGMAHDLAWGEHKDQAADDMLAKAAALADDLVEHEAGSPQCRFHVASRALAADVGLHGKLDPTPWVNLAVRAGDALIDGAAEAERKSQVQWEVAMALYDGLQVFQMRSEQAAALKFGELAISYLEKSGRQKQSPAAAYISGRLYFRVGAIFARRDNNHNAAVVWFEKAVPLLGQSPPPDVLASLGGLGETFVSMAVSYWEVGNRQRGLALTQHGTDLMESAVKRGSLPKSVLAIPYANLAAMQRALGDNQQAARLEEMASRVRENKVR
jgi:tetratricopeptide (TPR) repeat protein